MTKNKDKEKKMQRRRSDDPSTFERHAQTIIGAILIGLIIWVGSTVTKNNTSITKITVQVGFLVEKVRTLEAQLKEASEDRYKAKEAEIAHARIHDTMSRMMDRLRAVEQAVGK